MECANRFEKKLALLSLSSAFMMVVRMLVSNEGFYAFFAATVLVLAAFAAGFLVPRILASPEAVR